MKKFLSLLLTAMLLSCFSATAEADPEWRINKSTGLIKRNSSFEASDHIVVPAEVDGVPVMGLEYMALSFCKEMSQLTIPDSVRFFDRGSLSGLSNLKEVKLPAGLVAILRGSIERMDSLESLVIPASVSVIQSSIYDLDSIKSITFEGMCPVFVKDDFYTGFSGLPADCVIYVPDDQLDAYENAFADRDDVLARIRTSGKNAVAVDWTAPESDFVFDAASGTIIGYKGNASRLEIPAAIGGVPVKHIGSKAFMKCYSLMYVTIPEGVETVGDYAFQGNTLMTYVSFPSTLRSLGSNAFSSNNLVDVRWSEGLESVGNRAFYNCDIDYVTLPKTLRTIADNGFERAGIVELTFGPNVESVGALGFANNLLTGITYTGDAMPKLAADAFKDNKKDAAMNLADGSAQELYDGFVAYMAGAFPTCVVNEPAGMGMALPTLDVMAGMPFFGNWYGVAAMEGEDIYAMDTLGMSMDVVLNADASGSFDMGGEVITGAWYVENGAAMFAPILEEGGKPDMTQALPLMLDENGRIVADMGGICLLLEQEGKAYAVPAIPERPWPEIDQENAGDFIGTWEAVTYLTEEDEYDAALMGAMTLILNEDGTAAMLENGVDTGVELRWYVDGAVAFAGPTMNDLAKVIINGHGNLEMSQDSMVVVMEPEKEVVSAPAAAPIGADGAAFIGEWTLESASGMSAALLGLEMVLTLNEDGSCTFYDGYETETDVWSMEDGKALVQGAYLTINAEGKMVMSDDGMDMIFTQGEISGGELSEEEQMLALLAMLAEMEEGGEAAAAPANDTILGKWDDGAKILDIYEDGRMELTYKSDGYVSKMTWEMADGVPTVTTGIWKNTPIKVENGLLIITKDTLYQEFTRVGEAPATIVNGNQFPVEEMPEAVPAGIPHVPGTMDDFIGGWIGAEDESMQILLLENEANLINGTECLTVSWEVVNGVAEFNGMKLYLQEDWSGILEMYGEQFKLNRGYVEKPKASAPVAPVAGNAIGADGTAFIGEWTLESAAGMSASMLGMEMVLTLNEDGTCTFYDGYETDTDVWSMVDGKALVQGAYLAINADGKMVMSDDGMDLIFTQGDVSSEMSDEDLLALLAMLAEMEEGDEGAEVSEPEMPEELKPYVGTWHLVYCGTGGMSGDLRPMGITCTLTLGADGKAEMSFPFEASGTWMQEEDGTVRFADTGFAMTMIEGGFLQYGTRLGGFMMFSQDENATWSPEVVATATPAPVVNAPVSGGFASMQDRLEKKFVLSGYSMGGVDYPKEYAGEYTLVFHENGKVDFVAAGMQLPGTTWKLDQVARGLSSVDAFVINYAGQINYNAILTETGFDMDYYGMMLHFVLE